MASRVSISQIRFDKAPAVLKAYGLGSCVAVSIYDPESRLGALGHMLLPARPGDAPHGTEDKYVDAGICRMVEMLIKQGASKDHMEAKIAGGANMFESIYQTLIHSIGARNVKSAKRTLAVLGIPTVGEEVGGNRGRTVEFDLATGKMMVYCARKEEAITL
jgi:chemotaxis protein CheD